MVKRAAEFAGLDSGPSLPSPRMADTRLSYINAPDITIDEAFVGLSGSVPTIDITAAVASGSASTVAAGLEDGTLVDAMVLGDGTGSPSLTLEKTELGTDQIRFVSNDKVRGKLTLNATEDTSLSAFNTSEVLVGSVSISGTTGAIMLMGALAMLLADCREAADDAAAALLVPAVPVGGFYRTGSALKIRAA